MTTRLGRLHQDMNSHYVAAKNDGIPVVPFSVALPNGRVLDVGDGEAAFTISVADATGLAALKDRDQLQLAIGYMNEHLDITGDMLAALAMRKYFSDRRYISAGWKFVRPFLFGQVSSDREFISQHYDRESEFFLTFLDTRHRCYTEGVFESEYDSLEDAMTRKMDYAIEAAGIKPGDRVLEVGGGWGAFAEYASSLGVDVTTLTISAESERYLNDLAAERGLDYKVVREHVYEYRNDTPFDAIVNMGVTEHLPDYPRTLRAYERLLKPGGRVYLDALAAASKYRVSSFMTRYIYPGNASPMSFHAYLAAVAKSDFSLKSVLDDRHNYYLTCKMWAERLDAARDEVVSRWGESLYRRFRLFLWGSAASFRANTVWAYRWVLEH